MSPSHALPQPCGVQVDALKRGPSWAKSQAPSRASGSSFREVHGSSGQGLGLGQSGSSAFPGLRNILIIHWECSILARFVHQLFPVSDAEGLPAPAPGEGDPDGQRGAEGDSTGDWHGGIWFPNGKRKKKKSFHQFWSRRTSLTQASGVHALPEGTASGSWKGAWCKLGLR